VRKESLTRKTLETDIVMSWNLDGTGVSNIDTGLGFFDHMLLSFAKHGGFDLEIVCKGDLKVDGHHTVEDVGIVLGQLFTRCIGDKRGIQRFGTAFTPMDEALASCSLDISGRPYLVYQAPCPQAKAGDFESCLAEEFFRAFAMNAQITLHINLLYGQNTHHILEAIFKSFGRALKDGVKVVGSDVPSTKGCL